MPSINMRGNCACKNHTIVNNQYERNMPGHNVVILHRDHPVHFRWGSAEHPGKNYWRDYVEFCAVCNHICYDTAMTRDNGDSEQAGEWRVAFGDPALLTAAKIVIDQWKKCANE